jgi:hypothetical protein
LTATRHTVVLAGGEDPVMIIVHRRNDRAGQNTNGQFDCQTLGPGETIPADALWIDLVEPTREEDQRVEHHLDIANNSPRSGRHLRPDRPNITWLRIKG